MTRISVSEIHRKMGEANIPEKDFNSTVCTRLYLPTYGVEERCRLGFNNNNQCVAGHPYCKEYRPKGK